MSDWTEHHTRQDGRDASSQCLSASVAEFFPAQPHNQTPTLSTLAVGAPEFIPGSTTKGVSGDTQMQRLVHAPAFVPKSLADVPEFIPGSTNCSIPVDAQMQRLIQAPEFVPRSLGASANCFVPAIFQTASLNQTTSDIAETSTKEKPLCRFFQKGACRHGLQCPFLHDARSVAETRDNSNNVASLDSNENQTELHVVHEGIRCHFGPGATVLDLQLGSSSDTVCVQGSKRILISGLNSEISDYDLEARLSSFGRISILVRKHHSYALCTFGDSNEASAAVSNLNGTPVAAWSCLAKKDQQQKKQKGRQKDKISQFVSVALVAETGQPLSSTRNATVKLQWYAPSRVAWLHFHQRSQAEKVARMCNGKIFSKRTVSFKFQRPSFDQRCSFSVWVGGLGEIVNKGQLSQWIAKTAHGTKPASIQLESATYSDVDGAKVLRQLLLSKGGLLVHFEEDKLNCLPDGLKRKALAKFAEEEAATKACSYFSSIDRVPGLGGTRVYCQRVFSAKFTLETSIFLLVEEACRNAIQSMNMNKPKQGTDVRFKIFYNTNSTSSLLLQADDAKRLASVKNRISPIVDGELILDPYGAKKEQKVPLWKNFFASRGVASRVMEQVVQRFGQKNIVVLFQNRRREVRMFAKSNLLEQARSFVVEKLTSLTPEGNAVPISPDQYKFLLMGGKDTLETLTTTCRATVSLDIKHQALLVEGSHRDAKRTVGCLTRMMSPNNPAQEDANEDLCPICFCSPDEEGTAIELACSHRYCQDCFDTWLCGGRQTCSFPLQCLAEGCNRPLSMEELDQYLSRPDFLSLLRSSVDSHVLASLSKYQFCVSAGCNGIYATPSSNDKSCRTSTCSSCQMLICCSCKTLDHEGLTCEQYKIAKLPPNRLRNHIVEEILTLKCPRCSCAFLDFDGCFALTCSNCNCGFCGWCLRDCGSDAHSHVKTCTSKPREARNETYFGTKDQFHAAQKKRRREELVKFLQRLGSDERYAVLKSIQQDLKDLSLHDVSVASIGAEV